MGSLDVSLDIFGSTAWRNVWIEVLGWWVANVTSWSMEGSKMSVDNGPCLYAMRSWTWMRRMCLSCSGLALVTYSAHMLEADSGVSLRRGNINSGQRVGGRADVSS